MKPKFLTAVFLCFSPGFVFSQECVFVEIGSDFERIRVVGKATLAETETKAELRERAKQKALRRALDCSGAYVGSCVELKFEDANRAYRDEILQLALRHVRTISYRPYAYDRMSETGSFYGEFAIAKKNLTPASKRRFETMCEDGQTARPVFATRMEEALHQGLIRLVAKTREKRGASILWRSLDCSGSYVETSYQREIERALARLLADLESPIGRQGNGKLECVITTRFSHDLEFTVVELSDSRDGAGVRVKWAVNPN